MSRPRRWCGSQSGSAVIEMTWLGLVLIVPLVYVVMTLVTVQRSAYGATEAARAAGRAYVLAPDVHTATDRAYEAARIAMLDQGVRLDPHSLVISCSPTAQSCLQPGSTVRIRIDLSVDLPLVPAVFGQSAAQHRRLHRARRAVRCLPRRGPMTGAARPRRLDRRGDEAGQITAMLVIFSLCLLIAVSAVTDIAASYLRRQAVTSLADGAALAASDAAAAASVYDGGGDYVPIDQTAATAAVGAYLTSIDAYTRYPGLSAQVVVDGYTVRVSLTMPYQLPINLPGVDDTTTIHASGASTMPIY